MSNRRENPKGIISRGLNTNKSNPSSNKKEAPDQTKIPALVIGGALVGNMIVPGIGGAIVGGILGGLVGSQTDNKNGGK